MYFNESLRKGAIEYMEMKYDDMGSWIGNGFYYKNKFCDMLILYKWLKGACS